MAEVIEALESAAVAIAEQRAGVRGRRWPPTARRASTSPPSSRRARSRRPTLHAQLHRENEARTETEVRLQRAGDRAAELERELAELAARLELEARAGRPRRCPTRSARRSERGSSGWPAAASSSARSTRWPSRSTPRRVEHVEELERQRADLEDAMRELEKLIADTDRQIRETFEQTFEAAAQNFEEVAAQLFPGGRGRLRLVAERDGPARVLGGAAPPPTTTSERPRRGRARAGGARHGAGGGPARGRDRDHPGGQGDEAAVAAVRRREVDDRARVPVRGVPRPAVPVLHPRRGRGGARRPQHRPLPGSCCGRYSGRAQFIVVTHQKRTMEAADSLYGVSMSGDGDLEGDLAPAGPEEAAA